MGFYASGRQEGQQDGHWEESSKSQVYLGNLYAQPSGGGKACLGEFEASLVYMESSREDLELGATKPGL